MTNNIDSQNTVSMAIGKIYKSFTYKNIIAFHRTKRLPKDDPKPKKPNTYSNKVGKEFAISKVRTNSLAKIL